MPFCKFCWIIALIVAAQLMQGAGSAQDANLLTRQEKDEGWRLLFNGKDLRGWHSYLEMAPGDDWHASNDTIVLTKKPSDQFAKYADLVTDDEYENFDLKLEWKAAPCIDSGVMFHVHESPEYRDTYMSGPEIQIADLACTEPDSRVLKERSGDVFDLISDDIEWVRAAGEWNQFEIIADRGHLLLFQNGHKVIDTVLWGRQWDDLVAHSKFTTMPHFGTFRRGHISLQGAENKGEAETKIAFRNIKIKVL